jgi:hypothetical protein
LLAGATIMKEKGDGKKKFENARKNEKIYERATTEFGSAQHFVNRLFHGFESYDRRPK